LRRQIGCLLNRVEATRHDTTNAPSPSVTVAVRPPNERNSVELGAFSISLAVKDMAVSRDFYSKLGFEMIAGDGETWTIMANRSHAIGLFYGMFESNIMTFNPGWAGLGEPIDKFTDVRQLSQQLKAQDIEPVNDTTGDAPAGPASFTIIDPDGNAILIDQHV
jgi:catechol 2,3-dioxygenase-like lactoylglutathione lyase family enzyme